MYNNGCDLVTIDSKGKIRVASFEIKYIEEDHGFFITRQTGCLGGKMTEQPSKLITQGKAKRTVEEQADLEFKSLINKMKDKGYKQLDKSVHNYTESELREIIGDVATDSNGFAKHMKAKPIKDCKESSIEKVKEWWVSRKIDGRP